MKQIPVSSLRSRLQKAPKSCYSMIEDLYMVHVWKNAIISQFVQSECSVTRGTTKTACAERAVKCMSLTDARTSV